MVSSLVLALVATGCELEREALGCLASQPAVAADYAAAFAQRSGPWNGGDVGHVVHLDQGRQLWLFGDTFMDRSSTGYQHNSLVLQDGRCFTALTKGDPGSRSAPLVPSAEGTMVWPVDGIYDAATGQVTILSIRLAATDGTAPGWDFKVVGSDIEVVTFKGDGSVEVSDGVPAPAPQGVAGLHWDSVATVGDRVYIYGWTIDSTHVVARSTTTSFAGGPWEYWGGSGWSTSYAAAAPMVFDRNPRATLNVVAVGGGYLAAAKSWDTVSTDLWTWFSTSPTGPWTWVADVAYTAPVRPGWVSYDARVEWLPGAGWTAIWSENALDPANLDVGLYGPRFAAVTDPSITRLQPRSSDLPFGSLDVVSPAPGGVTAAGWAIDPDTSGPIDVHVYVDSYGVAVRADASRPDVGVAYPWAGSAHGWRATVPAAPGAHTVCAYGINVEGGWNSLLGCSRITLPADPIGFLDVARRNLDGSVTVAGWSIDLDTSQPIQVHVYLGTTGWALVANGTRGDVGAVYPAFGPAHGYSATLPAAPGPLQVCAYGINQFGTPGVNTVLGCRVV